MQSEILNGINSSYLYFPEDEGTILSSGKFSVSYIGADAKKGFKVVIKKLSARYRNNERAKLRFLIEASVQVNHPGIVKTLDLIKNDESFYIVQEYINGVDLKQMIKNNTFTRETTPICKFMLQLLDALQAIHNQNIVHRDIKPSNIIFAYKSIKEKDFDWHKPDVNIIDFGLSKTNDKIPLFDDGQKRHPYSILYSAPEVVLNREDIIDQRSDIYSAGLVMMEMFTGQPVFFFDNPAKIISRQISEQPKRPAKMYPRFYDIFLKSTAKERLKTSPSKMPDKVVGELLNRGLENRYNTAEEMKNDILDFMKNPGEMPKKGLSKFFGK